MEKTRGSNIRRVGEGIGVPWTSYKLLSCTYPGRSDRCLQHAVKRELGKLKLYICRSSAVGNLGRVWGSSQGRIAQPRLLNRADKSYDDYSRHAPCAHCFGVSRLSIVTLNWYSKARSQCKVAIGTQTPAGKTINVLECELTDDVLQGGAWNYSLRRRMTFQSHIYNLHYVSRFCFCFRFLSFYVPVENYLCSISPSSLRAKQGDQKGSCRVRIQDTYVVKCYTVRTKQIHWTMREGHLCSGPGDINATMELDHKVENTLHTYVVHAHWAKDGMFPTKPALVGTLQLYTIIQRIVLESYLLSIDVRWTYIVESWLQYTWWKRWKYDSWGGHQTSVWRHRLNHGASTLCLEHERYVHVRTYSLNNYLLGSCDPVLKSVLKIRSCGMKIKVSCSNFHPRLYGAE